MWEMFAAEYAPLDAAPALTVGGPPSPQPPPSRDPQPAADPQPPAQAAAQLPSREQVDAPA
jgi:hypothetical protein